MSEDQCPWRIKTHGGQVHRCALNREHPKPLDEEMPWAHHARETKRAVEVWSEDAPEAYNPEASTGEVVA